MKVIEVGIVVDKVGGRDRQVEVEGGEWGTEVGRIVTDSCTQAGGE